MIKTEMCHHYKLYLDLLDNTDCLVLRVCDYHDVELLDR